VKQHPRRQRNEGCVSDFKLDAWLSGDLDPVEGQAVSQHLSGCGLCHARHAEIAGARADFDVPFVPEARAPAKASPRGRLLAFSAAALALAAGVALFVRAASDDSGVRTKGDVRFGFYVLHDGEVRAGGTNEPLSPGDGLRFVARSNEAAFVAVLSLDAAARASIYYPAADRAAPLPAGIEQVFDSSVVLDETLGEERLLALFCREPVALEPLRLSLESGRYAFAPPPGCEGRALVVRKVPRP
jgi:anti-sigma factor RsiW